MGGGGGGGGSEQLTEYGKGPELLNGDGPELVRGAPELVDIKGGGVAGGRAAHKHTTPNRRMADSVKQLRQSFCDLTVPSSQFVPSMMQQSWKMF